MTFLGRLVLVIAGVLLVAIALWQFAPSVPQGASPPPGTAPSRDVAIEGARDAAVETSPSMARDEPALPQPNGTALIVPVAGIGRQALVDTFEQERAGGARSHEGIDIMAPTGTPVVAAARGTIEKLFLSDAGGKTVYIRSPDRSRLYYYAHLDSYAPGLREGQVIVQGQEIGTVGYSGNANPEGPHLHFEIRDIDPGLDWYAESRPLNPYGLLVEHQGAGPRGPG